MQRQFSLTHTVRYDECNCDGYLTPAAFLRYMQGLAALDAEEAQLAQDGFWIVKRTLITFKAQVPVHTRLALKTFAQGFSRITASRGYEARIADEPEAEPVIQAHTLWVYVDRNGRPKRMPEGTGQIWMPEGVAQIQPDPPLATFPDVPVEQATAVVRFSDTDLMRHLNNAASVEMLDNAAWEAYARGGLTPDMAHFAAQSYDIEYLDSPLFGDQLAIETQFEPFPVAGQEFSRYQQITRGGKSMIRAHSRWLYLS